MKRLSRLRSRPPRHFRQLKTSCDFVNNADTMTISKEVLRMDPVAALRQIEAVLPKQVFRQLKRRGVVVGLSGGIDSSVTTAICAKILGCEIGRASCRERV